MRMCVYINIYTHIHIHIRKDLTLTRPCPQLDVLLSRDSAAGGHQNLLDLLGPDSRDDFCSFVHSEEAAEGLSGSSSSLATTMHVDLNNARQATIRAQLYRASYVDAQGQLRYLFGIRESGVPGEASFGVAMPPRPEDMQETLATLHRHWVDVLGRQTQPASIRSIDERSLERDRWGQH